MNAKGKESFLRRAGTRSVLSSLISIAIGLLAGAAVILVVGLANPDLGLASAWDGIRLAVLGLFSTGRNATGALTFGFNPTTIGNMLFRATPVIMTGLSVAVAFKTGLFNIGAPGQYLAGTAASLFIALSIPSSAVPAWLIWILAFFGGMLAGAIWGAIPGLLKALLNINEVIASIMTNWIAANLVTWLFDISNLKNVTENTKSGYIYKTTFNGVATAKMGLDQLFPGSQVNGGILVAIALAVIVYVILSRTTFGYELRPAEPIGSPPGMRASRTSGTSCFPWPLPGRWPGRARRCIICRATRNFSGPPISPCLGLGSTASRWRCWRPIIPSA